MNDRAIGLLKSPTVVLRDDADVPVPGLRIRALDDESRRRLLRLADVVSETRDGTVLRRNRRLLVGRTSAGVTNVVVPPPVGAAEFLTLVVFAMGGNLSGVFKDDVSSADAAPFGAAPDEFLRVLAALCVYEAETILRRHVAKAYKPHIAREPIVRGRPLWTPDFGRHPSEGVTCRTQELSTDALPNRLLLAGLSVARVLLDGSPLQERAGNQIFIWRSLVEPSPVRMEDFQLADVRTTRLTEHYRQGLALSRVLVGGYGTADVFGGAGLPVPHFEFSLPGLFEQVLVRLLRPIAETNGLEVRFKEVDRNALVDGDGRTYREVEPDITLWRDDVPLAVIDAKFKPRYLVAQLDGSVAVSNRVTNEDIYQLFFYQSRLQAIHGLAAPPAAWIVAPLTENYSMPSVSSRTIRLADSLDDGVGLFVESLSLRALGRVLRQGTAKDALATAAPSLHEQLLKLAERSRVSSGTRLLR